jgi:hypothetical protein
MADDFQEGRSRAIQINEAIGAAAFLVVQHLAGVFFEVNADYADPLCAILLFQVQAAVVTERQIVLADLIILGQVGIVVVLAVPFRERSDLAIEGQRRLEGQVERPAIHDGQRAGQPAADGARG